MKNYVNFNVDEQAIAALEEKSGLSGGEIINKALTLFGWVVEEVVGGKSLVSSLPDGSNPTRFFVDLKPVNSSIH